VLSLSLALALGLGGALVLTERSCRETTIGDYRQQVARLTEANVALQGQVDGLLGERARFAQERVALSQERDNLVAERDALTATVAELETTVAEYQRQVTDLNARLSEQGRQLTQARQEASRQQTRAEEAFGETMAQVVALDDEIHEEFGRLFLAVIEMQEAYYQRNVLAFESAFYRAEQSKIRLDQLFAERDRLLAEIGY
jgi:chromosome segregation ATPase